MGNNISMTLENVVLDYDYAVVDVLNRRRAEKIGYKSFEEERVFNIWNSRFILSEERLYRKEYNREVLCEMEELPMVVRNLNKLIDEGYKVHIFSNFFDKDEVRCKLLSIGVKQEGLFVYERMLGMDRVIKLAEIGVLFYIEDSPEMIKLVSEKGILVVVKDGSYNRNFKNRLRLDCLSELSRIIERAEEGV